MTPPLKKNKQAHNAHRYRVFYSLNFSAAFCSALDHYREQWHIQDARPVPLSNFHLTLRFIGEVDDKQLDELLLHPAPAIAPFSLSFGEPGYFHHAKVLYLSPLTSHPSLLDLVKHCERIPIAGLTPKKEAHYRAHITLFRDAQQAVSAPLHAFKMTEHFSDFCLMLSRKKQQGVQYDVIQRWSLQRPLRPQPGP